MEENKQLIVQRLMDALVLTRQCACINHMEYVQNGADSYVEIITVHDTLIRVDVTADSGFSMILDIVRALR